VSERLLFLSFVAFPCSFSSFFLCFSFPDLDPLQRHKYDGLFSEDSTTSPLTAALVSFRQLLSTCATKPKLSHQKIKPRLQLKAPATIASKAPLKNLNLKRNQNINHLIILSQVILNIWVFP
jgi:hypothetical protein